MGETQVESHTGQGCYKSFFLHISWSYLSAGEKLLQRMVSINTYQTWNVTAPSLLSVLLWLVIFIAMAVVLYFFKKLPRFFVGILQLSLSDIEEDEDCTCVTVDGHKIKKRALKLLAILVIPLTVVTIFFSFWNVWLVEEEATGDCLPNFDCFPILGDRRLQDSPIGSCSESFNISMLGNLDSTTNDTDTSEIASDAITYKCYRFVFNYAEGIGAAGGILFFTAVFSKIYFCLLVAIITSKRCEFLCLGFLIFVLFLALAVVVLFVVVNILVPIIREAVFQTHTDTVQFVLYALNFAAVVIGGYVVSIGVILPRLTNQK